MRELRVTPIKNGTVIDHIPAGMALKVLKILGIGDKYRLLEHALAFTFPET